MSVAYKDSDKCTDAILDFIAGGWHSALDGKQHMMESGGNYNAVIGNAHSSNDLSTYTIASIYNMQQELLQKGRPSTAVGRYQIIRGTLRRLCDIAHVVPIQLFTPEFQDRCAWLLLCEAQYKNWWLGQLSPRDFAHNIAGIWASLPDPMNSGKSRYDGVGPNHAGCGLVDLYDMLQKAWHMRP